MPASITHGYFALDLYDILPMKYQELLKEEKKKLVMFAQGSDPLMFYHILSCKRKKKGRYLQKYFHTTKTQDFFIHLIQNIKRSNEKNNSEITAYLYGSIAHYVLDSTIHPYVIYYTGCFKKKDKKTHKYNNLHSFMEAYIDMDMVKRRTKKNPYAFSTSNFLFDHTPLSNKLISIIDRTYFEVYHIENIGKIYNKSFPKMKHFLRLFRYDKTGIKRFFYRLIDTFTPDTFFRTEVISYHVPLANHHFLNEEHSTWCHPANKDLKSTDSFIDLYTKALIEAKNIILQVNRYLEGEGINLKEIFDNRSYVSGMNCEEDITFQYFRF